MNPTRLTEHLPGLRRYARALTGSQWAADDLVQDTLERACTKWSLWLAGTDLRAWLFTLMHNIYASDVRRAIRRQVTAPTDDWDESVTQVAAQETDLDTRIDLQRCLMQLPEEQRIVLLLVGMEGLSYSEVAHITRTPLGTVMSRLSRARLRLHLLMDASPHEAQDSPPVDNVVHLPLKH
ncbi:sigma-70 family RNA polymerase sigma factor [Rhodoferax sp.]|uniref:sigma-70 family RNA polymerase sigma factor n=1 Tax=Rhodoferax sp. TaxID=50421 RepID=UPI0025EB01AA|nr:sigma-70 family RNA polymerase sigma factor [Rhodoferax sp.]